MCVGWGAIRKEGNVLFNDVLNTFYLRLYDVRHRVKDHSDSEKGNPLPPIGYSFRLTARVLLYAIEIRNDTLPYRYGFAVSESLHVLTLFNDILDSGNIPDIWKEGRNCFI